MLPAPSNWIVKLTGLALLGILIFTLLVPILLVLARLLGFVALGYVGWLAYKSFKKTPECSAAESHGTPAPASEPAQSSESEKCVPYVKSSSWLRDNSRWFLNVVIEALCGAAAGALLGLIATWSSSQRTATVACGALIGAALGVLVGNATSGESTSRSADPGGEAAEVNGGS